MSKCIYGFVLALTLPLFSPAQQPKGQQPDCASVKEGTFYFYPPDPKLSFVIIRKEGIQKEIDQTTSDTTFMKVTWRDDCNFDLRFVRDTHNMPQEQKDFMFLHPTVVSINKVTKDYYTFTIGMEGIAEAKPYSDTLWLKPRR